MKTGIDILINREFAGVEGKRVGLLTHPAALTADLTSTLDVFRRSEILLTALFGPEHGLNGEAQDMIAIGDASPDFRRVYSLYGDTFASLKPTAEMLDDLDVFIVDLVDVGSRYYTFQTTMLFCMQACAAVGLPVMVLDRPNPLGRTIEGPSIQRGFESFVGWHPICIRHGMTIGELAQLYRTECVPDVDLTVIPYEGDTVRPWVVPPSPNMPTLDTARVYPGMCLVEGTNLSEGRGTTRPFETVGHPAADPEAVIKAINWPEGVQFLPVYFTPTFHKHAGKSCGGVRIVPTQETFEPVRTGLAVLMGFHEVLGDAFRWRTETYEFVSHIPAIDLLFGSDRERRRINANAHVDEISSEWFAEEAAFRERCKPYLLYP